MKPSFDVLQEPWIPVVTFEGETLEVGILDALLRSPEWKEIQDPSPMVEYSVYRFLIVFLMDALRPETPVDLEELLYAGQFDESAIQDYITLCHSEGVSFDLFDPNRPFMQTSVDKNWDKQRKPVTTLDYTVPNGNNHIHFDHRRKHEVYVPGKAMRMLLTAQIFCTSAAQGYPSNVNGAPPWFSLVQGGNLFETLVRNMVYRDQIKVPFDRSAGFLAEYSGGRVQESGGTDLMALRDALPSQADTSPPKGGWYGGRTLFQPRHELFGSRQLAETPTSHTGSPRKDARTGSRTQKLPYGRTWPISLIQSINAPRRCCPITKRRILRQWLYSSCTVWLRIKRAIFNRRNVRCGSP